MHTAKFEIVLPPIDRSLSPGRMLAQLERRRLNISLILDGLLDDGILNRRELAEHNLRTGECLLIAEPERLYAIIQDLQKDAVGNYGLIVHEISPEETGADQEKERDAHFPV